MREFATALEEVLDEQDEQQDGMEFKVGDRICRCYPPADGQLAYLIASVGRHTNLQTKVAGIINFFVEVLDDDSNEYIVGRLLNRHDPFGMEEVSEIMEWMIEEWTGRPTQPPSGSTQSRPNGGQKSTRRTSKSTSSDSVLTAS